MTRQKPIQKSTVRPSIFSWFSVSVSLSRIISASWCCNYEINTLTKVFSFHFCEKKYSCPFSIDNVKIFENSLGKCRHYWDKNHPLTKHKAKETTKIQFDFLCIQNSVPRLLKAFRFISNYCVSEKMHFCGIRNQFRSI